MIKTNGSTDREGIFGVPSDGFHEWVNAETDRVNDECRAEMAAIDWEANALHLSDRIMSQTSQATQAARTREETQSKAVFQRSSGIWRRTWRVVRDTVSGVGEWGFGLKPVVPAFGVVFLLGIGLGYLLFRGPAVVSPYPGSQTAGLRGGTVSPSESPSPVPGATLARLERTLARKEAADYFKRSQFIMTGLLEQCSNEQTATWDDRVDMGEVRHLLRKGGYFRQDMNTPALLPGKDLLKKIEFLLFELSTLESDGSDASCEKLKQIRDYITQERLLFKIRLVEKELTAGKI